MASSTAETGLIAVVDAETAGAIVWWRLSGQLPLEDLAIAWHAAGLDPALLPKRPTPTESLARAMREHQSARVLARPLGGRRGWALVQETPSDSDLDYDTICTARVIADDNVAVNSDAPDELVHRVQDSYLHYRGTYTTADISTWISAKLIGQVEAIKLRETGGIYFVPRGHVELFRRWVSVLGSVSDHVVYEVPALKSEEAVEAILAALMTEADDEVEGMEDELDCEELGKRALKTRERRCEALRSKLQTYEELLGRSLDAMQERVEALQGTVVASILALDAEE